MNIYNIRREKEVKSMGFKDKADVMQGIAGGYWIAVFLSIISGTLPIGISIGYLSMLVILTIVWGIIPVILGVLVVWLKEEGGTDLFGFLSSLGLIVVGMYWIGQIGISTQPWLTLLQFIIPPILGIGLVLEAFDIIKPL